MTHAMEMNKHGHSVSFVCVLWAWLPSWKWFIVLHRHTAVFVLFVSLFAFYSSSKVSDVFNLQFVAWQNLWLNQSFALCSSSIWEWECHVLPPSPLLLPRREPRVNNKPVTMLYCLFIGRGWFGGIYPDEVITGKWIREHRKASQL